MLKVGLTGTIGSGKTTVAKYFEKLNVPVFYADERGYKFLNEKSIKDKLFKTFGPSVLTEMNEIDRKVLADIVFSNKEAMQYLTSITHPLIMEEHRMWLEEQDQSIPYAILESAIIIEYNYQKEFDFLIAVSAPEEVRIERVMQRDNVSREEVLRRINNQFDDDEKTSMADFIIYNYGKHDIAKQVNWLHEKILSC